MTEGQAEYITGEYRVATAFGNQLDTEILKRAYTSAGRRSWIVCDRASRILWNYTTGEGSTRELAQSLGVTVEAIRLWACAGQLRHALRGKTYTDESEKTWTVWDLRKALSLHHWQIAGRHWRKLELDPADILEWLAICANEGRSAEWLGAQIAPVNDSLFVQRLARLLKTPPPSDWSMAKREACEYMLKIGAELVNDAK